MVLKPFVCEKDETTGDNEVEELPGNFGHPKATQTLGQPLTSKILSSALSYHALGSALVN